MNKRTALGIAGFVLAVVVSTTGEDGVVPHLADRAPADPVPDDGTSQDTSPDPTTVSSSEGSAWFAPDIEPAQPTVPVYRPQAIHVSVPQEIVDPAMAAASPIK